MVACREPPSRERRRFPCDSRARMAYRAPNFDQPRFHAAPEVRWAPAPADGVLPDGFFSTTNLPTYLKIAGEWRLPRDPRMDSAVVLDADGVPRILEGRYVRAGQEVAMGFAEDGSEGILVDAVGLTGVEEGGDGEFKFMSSEVSREKPVDYAEMARLLVEERTSGGRMLWVVGPAVLHSRGRDTLAWFIENGFVSVLFGGNAVAVHDIESDVMGTTLGMNHKGAPVEGGHAFHMRAINRVRGAGSIAAAVEEGVITGGIMHSLVTSGVPFVLAGSIRDDGPLPDTITDAVRAQEVMKEHTREATMVIMIATALHAIATGNMLPSYIWREDTGEIRPLTTICVDSSEFVVSKLKDRGTHQAFGVITNAQDFLHVLRFYVESEVAAREPAGV
jgi:lysine-ketoglutarate reductase/saccharopine dehydrogenase-like protein (TIGR00300 family)